MNLFNILNFGPGSWRCHSDFSHMSGPLCRSIIDFSVCVRSAGWRVTGCSGPSAVNQTRGDWKTTSKRVILPRNSWLVRSCGCCMNIKIAATGENRRALVMVLWFRGTKRIWNAGWHQLVCWIARCFSLFFPHKPSLLRVAVQVACMQLINALVTSPDELDLRLHIRNEFVRCGLKEVLPVSETHAHVCSEWPHVLPHHLFWNELIWCRFVGAKECKTESCSARVRTLFFWAGQRRKEALGF